MSPLGNSFPALYDSLYAMKSGVKIVPEWEKWNGLSTFVGGCVEDYDGQTIPRKMRRSMSRVSLLAVGSAQQAITDAKLTDADLRTERMGVAYGSTMGGTSAIEGHYRNLMETGSLTEGVLSTTFLQIMSHTCAANLALAFGIPGRVIASCTACAASTQAIGFAYETIRDGRCDRMLAGGAEELHAAVSGVFDVMGATSRGYNDKPHETPRPFSVDRDGIVVGEGGGTLILEEWHAAVGRGAKIYGEIVGFATNNDAHHMTNPSVEGMENVMRGALKDASLLSDEISYVNAHGTATQAGDHAESWAVNRVFGERMAISSIKGHFGHLMGACGVIETAACLAMLEQGMIVPTKNLDVVDPKCAPLNYVKGTPEVASLRYILKNSFAFGGINASLIIAKA